MPKQLTVQFFAYARERHKITLRRAHGEPAAWTRDPILQKYRFTNVYRELDKTTVWYRKNVRERYDGSAEVLLATVLFRMFNRIEVGEAIFCQMDMETTPPSTAFEQYLVTSETRILRHAITTYVGKKGPFATGAYIISSPPGMSKLDGILELVDNLNKGSAILGLSDEPLSWCILAGMLLKDRNTQSLEMVFNWIKQFPYFGKFHSYEIVTDLRHTKLLKSAPDKMSWCNIGPGAKRGINRVMGRDKKANISTEQMLDEMKILLKMSRDAQYWPQGLRVVAEYPKWEMREVEHTLCEFDKYMRVKTGEGRPRGVFR